MILVRSCATCRQVHAGPVPDPQYGQRNVWCAKGSLGLMGVSSFVFITSDLTETVAEHPLGAASGIRYIPPTVPSVQGFFAEMK